MKHLEHSEMYEPAKDGDGETELVQYLLDSGLMLMVNGVLHHYGLALCVAAGEDGETVEGFGIAQTTDPDGFWFDESTMVDGRRKLRAAGLLGASPRV